MRLPHSARVATGGMVTALCLLLMFMTGLIPFGTFALPAFAGFLMIVVVIEIGRGWAWIVFLGVSFLSILTAPDREAAVMFACFFGYYPILKLSVDTLSARWAACLVKIVICNAVLFLGYVVSVHLFHLEQVIGELVVFGKWGLLGFWLVCNAMFFAYDTAADRITKVYIFWFRPRFLRRL